MNIYEEKPKETETIKSINGYATSFCTEIRELTETEKEDNGLDKEKPYWTAKLIIYRHVKQLGENDYDEIVKTIIRSRYSSDDVEAIIGNYLADGSAKHVEEYEAWQQWRIIAKELARKVVPI